jgi:hypothetical protein
VAFVAATLFFRTRLHPTTETYGTLYLSTLFFALVHMMFNGFSEMSIMVARLPVFYKQRDNLFYPAWAFSVPSWLLRLPYSIAESIIWSCIFYYVVAKSERRIQIVVSSLRGVRYGLTPAVLAYTFNDGCTFSALSASTDCCTHLKVGARYRDSVADL